MIEVAVVLILLGLGVLYDRWIKPREQREIAAYAALHENAKALCKEIRRRKA